ncbi:MAG: putative amino acid permease YhdG [bacterium ADurb.Bin363]|nr:MAG: putative amino acid permease YhdG [bacterium ADurb.Bin363]
MSTILKTKNLNRILEESEAQKHKLNRALGPLDLIALGVGAIIGAGIFATIGSATAGGAAHLGAGPAIMLSFVITAICCAFTALCYAEFASLIPIAGSAYTYSYATLGELIAWIIGWDLIIEYAVGNIAVAISWSDYFVQLLEGLGIHFPLWLATNYRDGLLNPEIVSQAPHIGNIPIMFNLPAVAIVTILTIVLVVGIKESASMNNVFVGLKIFILLFFIVVGIKFIRPENWNPFMPNGWQGVFTGAALIFFAYIGFDAVSTTAEEARNPSRDLPIGMIGSLIVCTVIYILIAMVLTGMVPYAQLGTGDPLAEAFSLRGMNWAAGIISFGAVIAMAAVLLVFQLGQPRIFFSMSRDGLLPRFFAGVHPRFKTPHVTTILTGVFVAFFSAFANINEVVELCNIGTLFAFILVCLGVIILRHKDPQRKRPFKCPAVPLIPILGTISCLYLMLQLPLLTWIRFVYWLLIGLLIYFLYGVRHSALNEEKLSFMDSLRKNLKFLVPLVVVIIVVTWYIGVFLGSAMNAYEKLNHKIMEGQGKAAITAYISPEYKDYEKDLDLYLKYIDKNDKKPLSLLKKPIPGLDKAEFLMTIPEEGKCLGMTMKLTPTGWKIFKISIEVQE